MPNLGWITNDPAMMKKLKAVFRRYEKARKALPPMPLAQKIDAVKKLKEARAVEYARVLEQV